MDIDALKKELAEIYDLLDDVSAAFHNVMLTPGVKQTMTVGDITHRTALIIKAKDLCNAKLRPEQEG